jgi:hypothetical protein
MAADRPEPLIAIAWWREISRGLYADELGAAYDSAWGMRAPFVADALNGRGGSWPAHYDVDLSDGSVEVGAGGKVDGSDWSLKQ